MAPQPAELSQPGVVEVELDFKEAGVGVFLWDGARNLVAVAVKSLFKDHSGRVIEQGAVKVTDASGNPLISPPRS